ncbi:MAG: MFS transporter [Nocardioidaceae bacterium]|nr:MFS transporter [Nocardioidaceae bacterium]
MSSPRGTVAGPLPWAFVAVLVLVALNLRSPFVAVAPLVDELRDDLGVGGAGMGLLTTLPVLCFGLLAPVALLAVRRAGAERAVVICLGAVLVGALMRSGGGYALALVGTAVIGLGITVGNIVVPVLIRRETPPSRVGVVTGVHVAAMNLGSMIATLATVPLADATGWRFALGVWSLVAAVSIVAWWAFRSHRVRWPLPSPGATGAPPTAEGAPIWQRPLAWLLALAFAGQAASYYALTAWLPALLADEIGLGSGAAGAASSVFQVCAIIGAFGVPLLALRLPPWGAVATVGVLWLAFPVQLLVAPEAYLLGSVLGGVAQGGGFAAIFTIVVQVSRTDRESARLSAFVQGVGYVVAALAPTVVGAVHDATDAWTAPLLVVLATTALFTVLGTAAGVMQSRGAAAR